MNKLAGLVIFLLGTALGALVTWRAVKEIYEQYANDEIDSVKKVYEKRVELEAKKAELINKVTKKHEITEEEKKENRTILKSNAYVVESMDTDDPYVISPDEFGEKDDYETISLMYYEDDVLADDNEDKIDNVEDIIGYESLSHFGEYDDDTVYVRNDVRRTDYEIIRIPSAYAEVLKEKPYKRRENE